MTYNTHKRIFAFLSSSLYDRKLSFTSTPFKITSQRIPFIIINDFHRQTKINRTFEENRTKNAIYLDYIQSIKSMIVNTYIMEDVLYRRPKVKQSF